MESVDPILDWPIQVGISTSRSDLRGMEGIRLKPAGIRLGSAIPAKLFFIKKILPPCKAYIYFPMILEVVVNGTKEEADPVGLGALLLCMVVLSVLVSSKH